MYNRKSQELNIHFARLDQDEQRGPPGFIIKTINKIIRYIKKKIKRKRENKIYKIAILSIYNEKENR